jgi:pimeloyl-ACP methyl ester carboxylesterase
MPADELESIQSGDARIFYRLTGAGQALVLLHPYPTNHNFWNQIVPGLAGRYRLLVPDLRAHGASEPGEGPATMEKHAEDLSRLCRAAGFERAIFAGVSIGGYILFEFWRRYREKIQALILCDTKASADSNEARTSRLQIAHAVEREGPDAYLDSMVPKLLGTSTVRNRADLVAEARGMMAVMRAESIAAALRGMAVRPDSMAVLGAVTMPTLIMVGEEDTLTPPSDAEAMHNGIRNSQLLKIAAAGHYTPFEQPEASLRAMRRFLDSVRSA